MKQLRVGVVGLGWWGKLIVDQLRQCPSVTVVVATDRVPEPGKRFVAERGIAWVDDYDHLLAIAGIDAVILCTPHATHTGQILQAAEKGKHVFCEKPLALLAQEARLSIEAMKSRGLTLGLGHEKRFEPPIIEALARVRRGDIGIPLQMEANFNQDKFLGMSQNNWRFEETDAPAGPLTATGIHLIDLAVAVLGRAKAVTAALGRSSGQLRNGDTLGMLVEFEKGGHALIGAMLATPFSGRFALYGSTGWIDVRDNAHPEHPQGWTMRISRRGFAEEVFSFPSHPAVRDNLEAFAASILDGADYPIPTDDMEANVSILEAVVTSTRIGQRVQIFSTSRPPQL
ncbi:MAG: gfo/Idh/MocA family oxidoreductase [Betaproteobacteria bacterium]|jgi:predicted dehydrogenase|nr:Gfo/Idh/MocA family oxidoreductase [Pseudomonadota bacterium]NBO94404.1 gfo/Idh/MocA family oxidoreductase [Betaproteobacteria bacterium]NBP36848.1 gfo/Idh/MocA family oxidoreductase [Betaproteobacteria bacterium]NBQ95823.1 gfo/Idh/MocA family oxidoreductase [Betaproteobacteria bacterium]NBT72132.1 gfo/Idh/MocA family oxidoreductase [Betaproteobacteria bacterium]